jgi:NAD(P)H dehydrogenase (quinone)
MEWKIGAFFGGQETTVMNAISHFVHHGMIYVPLGFSSARMFELDAVHGGSPWGAGTFSAGDGSRQPSELELEVARLQGKRTAEITARYVRGGN